jgi:hypothetical protein
VCRLAGVGEVPTAWRNMEAVDTWTRFSSLQRYDDIDRENAPIIWPAEHEGCRQRCEVKVLASSLQLCWHMQACVKDCRTRILHGQCSKMQYSHV